MEEQPSLWSRVELVPDLPPDASPVVQAFEESRDAWVAQRRRGIGTVEEQAAWERYGAASAAYGAWLQERRRANP